MQNSRTQALDPLAAHVDVEKGMLLISMQVFFILTKILENNMPVVDPNKRPTRTTRGLGGRAVQLQKAVESIRPDLDPETGFKKQPAPCHNMGSFPSSTPENGMAPPIPQRQQKKSVTLFVARCINGKLII